MLAGALGGACAATLAVWFLGAHPGRIESELGAARSDLADVRVRHASLIAGLDERLSAVEARPAAAPQDAEARAAARVIAADLAHLQAAVRLELLSVDAELQRLTTIIDEVAGGLGGPDPAGPLPEEDEPRFVVLSADPDPGVRFSALVRLGRRRSDRSVQASLARLDDRDATVVWIALHNLGGFRERAAVVRVVGLLAHSAALVRQKSYDTLVSLGAPSDTGFDALAPDAERVAATQRLRAWADE